MKLKINDRWTTYEERGVEARSFRSRTEFNLFVLPDLFLPFGPEVTFFLPFHLFEPVSPGVYQRVGKNKWVSDSLEVNKLRVRSVFKKLTIPRKGLSSFTDSFGSEQLFFFNNIFEPASPGTYIRTGKNKWRQQNENNTSNLVGYRGSDLHKTICLCSCMEFK